MSPIFAPERRCYFGGHGNGTSTKHLKIKFESFRFSLLIILLSLQYFENYAVPLNIYIQPLINCKKKLHQLIMLEVHDSSEEYPETSETGLKKKKNEEED